MKKTLLLLSLTLTLHSTIKSQSKYFERVYDVQDVSDARKLFLNPDGTYIVIGTALSYSNYKWLPYYMRLNEFGDTLALHQYPNPDFSTPAWDAVKTQFGYAISVTQSQSDTTEIWRAYLMRISHNGNLLDMNPTGTNTVYHSVGRSILQTSDGGYILAGLAKPTISSYIKLYIVKLSADGSTEWEKVYDNFSYHNEFFDILPALDGGYYALGSVKRWQTWVAFEGWQYTGDMLLYKLDGNGEIEWQKTYFENGDAEGPISFCQSEDGSFYIAGERNYYTELFLKLDTAFTIQWQYFEGEDEGQPSYITFAPDGNLLISGNSHLGSTNGYVKKVALDGEILWKRIYGDAGHDYFYTHLILPDGSILLGGRNDIGAAAVYIVKTNCMGLLPQPAAAFSYEPQGANEIQFTNISLYAYPDSTDGGYYIWDFGDGSPPYLCGQGYAPCTGSTLTHQYPASGSYLVTLTTIVCSDTSMVQALIDTESGGGTVGAPPQPPEQSGQVPSQARGGVLKW
ncbi:PKD domain-containing protein [Sphingobacteriales bacterium UPWRP_1]|nr:hypothetical protein BVG80_18445 [Sphingobacteriales bacterium TSM_CSM]PSJ73372.1 PKD domain-containing protein [Sphingobacteriales bacterium UPWRP_1]